jgi:hypothetical protein
VYESRLSSGHDLEERTRRWNAHLTSHYRASLGPINKRELPHSKAATRTKLGPRIVSVLNLASPPTILFAVLPASTNIRSGTDGMQAQCASLFARLSTALRRLNPGIESSCKLWPAFHPSPVPSHLPQPPDLGPAVINRKSLGDRLLSVR